MAKILRGRISGRYGMEAHTADALHAWADRLERFSVSSYARDDSRFLRRWAKKIRCLAEQKETAREHKQRGKRCHRS